MPGVVTLKPVALASVVASSDSLVPSANDVTMVARIPCASAKPFCVSGLRWWSRKPLTLPASTGR